jgi:hypothetical protein
LRDYTLSCGLGIVADEWDVLPAGSLARCFEIGMLREHSPGERN